MVSSGRKPKIHPWENKYDELLQITPLTQYSELQNIKDKVLLAVRQDCEDLRVKRDKTLSEVKEKNERVSRQQEDFDRIILLVPKLIEDLKELGPRLHDV